MEAAFLLASVNGRVFVICGQGGQEQGRLVGQELVKV